MNARLFAFAEALNRGDVQVIGALAEAYGKAGLDHEAAIRALACDLRELLAGPAPVPHHNRHPWLQPGDRPHQVWMLRFDDNDLRDMIWTDEDAEKDARAAYERYSPTWNCYLFATVAAPVQEGEES